MSAVPAAVVISVLVTGCSPTVSPAADPEPAAVSEDAAANTAWPLQGRSYPWHTRIVATTFWVGEVFDPDVSDGSQVISTYDSQWLEHYGGCDGVVIQGECTTEPRTAGNDYFPTQMTPLENPFYLDLPFDDVNNEEAFAMRCDVIPWAQADAEPQRCEDREFSYMKNRWVEIVGPTGNVCYGQIEDAGPGRYDDADYVFGESDARPANKQFGGSGMDVSPALNGCLGFELVNGIQEGVSWRFVDRVDVPEGPWTRIETTSPVQLG